MAEESDQSKHDFEMEKELSLFCKNKNTERIINFKVLKTIGKDKMSRKNRENTTNIIQKKESLEKFRARARVEV